MQFEDFLIKAKHMGASDIHLVSWLNPKCRVNGNLVDLGEESISPTQCDEMARQLAGDKYEEFITTGDLDIAVNIKELRCRVNLFRQQSSTSIVARLINDHIPTYEELRLPAIVKEFPTYKNGIVLVTGETGAGKSTTLAAVIGEINRTQSKHILTLEDPIEYIHDSDKCVVNQRAVGIDTMSFSTGLRAAMREDPDVILVGEMRDFETIEAALTAAETGHLVFGTIHTNSAADTIDRLIGVFPDNRQQQARLQLAQCLRAVLCQQLIPTANGKGRVVCCEVMKVETSIRTLIRESKTQQVSNAIASTQEIGNFTMDRYLQMLLQNRIITKATYEAYATPNSAGTVGATTPNARPSAARPAQTAAAPRPVTIPVNKPKA